MTLVTIAICLYLFVGLSFVWYKVHIDHPMFEDGTDWVLRVWKVMTFWPYYWNKSLQQDGSWK